MNVVSKNSYYLFLLWVFKASNVCYKHPSDGYPRHEKQLSSSNVSIISNLANYRCGDPNKPLGNTQTLPYKNKMSETHAKHKGC